MGWARERRVREWGERASGEGVGHEKVRYVWGEREIEWAERVGEKERRVREWGEREVWVSFASEGEGQVKGV